MDVERSQRAFVGVTLITVLSIAVVLVVYATLLGTFSGGEVTVGGIGPSQAQIRYSFNNANDTGPWTATLNPSDTATSWYARFEITGGDYSGPVTITWQLQLKIGTSPETWSNTGSSETTSIVLSGSPEIIYASSDGTFAAGNYDWSAKYTEAGTYRIYVTVDSA